MARVQEACFFCGEVPCVCGKVNKPSASNGRVGNRPRVERLSVPESGPKIVPFVAPTSTATDSDLVEAIQTLADYGMLAESEHTKYQGFLRNTPSLEARSYRWREARKEKQA